MQNEKYHNFVRDTSDTQEYRDPTLETFQGEGLIEFDQRDHRLNGQDYFPDTKSTTNIPNSQAISPLEIEETPLWHHPISNSNIFVQFQKTQKNTDPLNKESNLNSDSKGQDTSILSQIVLEASVAKEEEGDFQSYNSQHPERNSIQNHLTW
jgi:hypothetical protein